MIEVNHGESGSKRPKGFLDEMGYDPDRTRSDLRRKDIEDYPSKPIKPRQLHTGKISYRIFVVIIGIILVLGGTLFALSSMTARESKAISDTEEYRVFNAVLASKELNYELGPGSLYFDAGKLMAADGQTLKSSIVSDDISFQDFHFSIEIIDVSIYPVHYNRSSLEGNAIETSPSPTDNENIDIMTFETGVNIFINFDEVHSARFIMKIWKV